MSVQAETPATRLAFVPWLFPLGLAIVVSVNLCLLWFALHTFPGVVSANAYEDGRRYNHVLEMDAARQKLGWQIDIKLSASTPGTVEIRGRDRDGRPIGGVSTQVIAMQPVGRVARIELPIEAVEPGLWHTSLALPARGVWDILVLLGETGQQQHQFTARLVNP